MQDEEEVSIEEEDASDRAPSPVASRRDSPGSRGSVVVALVGAAVFVAGAGFMAYDYAQKARLKRELVRAERLEEQGRLEEAVAQYERVVQLYPDNPEAWVGLGIAAYRVGDSERSAAAYRRAIALDHGLRIAHNNLAFVLYDDEKIDRAVAEWERALGLPPRTRADGRGAADCLAGLGIGYLAQGRRQQAAGMYGRAAIRNRRYLDMKWMAKQACWSPKALTAAEQLIPAARQRRARWLERRVEDEEEE